MKHLKWILSNWRNSDAIEVVTSRRPELTKRILNFWWNRTEDNALSVSREILFNFISDHEYHARERRKKIQRSHSTAIKIALNDQTRKQESWAYRSSLRQTCDSVFRRWGAKSESFASEERERTSRDVFEHCTDDSHTELTARRVRIRLAASKFVDASKRSKNPQTDWPNARCMCVCTKQCAATLVLLLLPLWSPQRIRCYRYLFSLAHAILQRKKQNGKREKKKFVYLHFDGVIFWYNSLVGFSNSRTLLVVFTFVGSKKIFK